MAEVKHRCRLYLQFPAQPSALIEAQLAQAVAGADTACVLICPDESPIDQIDFELVDRGIEPLGGLFQSVRLTHRAEPPRAPLFFQLVIKLLDPRFNVNVVTARPIFNNCGLPLSVPAHGD